MNKKWEICNTNLEKVEEISKKYNISNLLAVALVNRGLSQDEDLKIFLNPTRKDFHDPFLLPDMDKAVDRILKAIENKEKVIIYGDYDVDGITSITVLKKFLEERGIEVQEHIPNRLEEGYGLNIESIKEIAKQKYTLMITVDCGISGLEEVKFAKELGIETIITDHHEPLEELPEAIAIVDAKIKTSKYPFRGLAGVGVVFKLIQAIGIKLGLEEKEYLKFLDLVCVGTISDIVPLIDENRVIAKLGLKLVEVTKNHGLAALLKAAGYKNIDSNSVSFGIAPRINACGRMGYQEEALNLFLAENSTEAEMLTERLNSYNKQRQEIEKRIYEEATKKIEELKNESAIVLGEDNWHHGVIGIVASKITEIYFKPTILICFEGEDGKGSGRSIQGFDLHNALCKSSEYLEKYGGHEMAVGLSLKKENFEKFKNKFQEIASQSKIEEIIPIIKIDSEITLNDLEINKIRELKMLEPFGEGNKLPIFLYRNLKIDSIRALSEGKHLKLTLKDKNRIIHAIGFNMGHLSEEYLIDDKVDVVGTLEINEFNGYENIQINLKDIMKSY